MKQRNGFVSNSSSSSFIIGLGIVPAANVSKFKQYLEANKINEIGYKTVGELVDDPRSAGYDIDVEIEYDELGNGVLSSVEIESFNYDSIKLRSDVLSNLSSQDLIAYMYDSYGDDCDFYTYNEDGEIEDWDCDYDIGWDFFPEAMQTAGEVFDQAFMQNGQSSYGAGRNG